MLEICPSCIEEVFGSKRNNFNCDMVDGCQTCVKDVSNKCHVLFYRVLVFLSLLLFNWGI